MKKLIIVLFLITALACQSTTKVEVQKTEQTRLDALVYYYSKAEGELAYCAADLLHLELIFNPLEWYQAMSQDTSSFNRYLKDLRNKVFVAHAPFTVQDLEDNRQQLLSLLQEEIETPPKYLGLSERLIRELEDIKPREIYSTTKVEVQKTEQTRLDALVYYYSKAEGEGAHSAAHMLYLELLFNPLEWYQAMSQDTSSFNRYLKDLRNKVFVAYALTVQELEEQRQQLLSRLKEIETPPKYLELSERLIRELEDIKPRDIY